MTRQEQLHAHITEHNRMNREYERQTAKHRQREELLNLATKLFTDQMTAQMDAQVWAMRNWI